MGGTRSVALKLILFFWIAELECAGLVFRVGANENDEIAIELVGEFPISYYHQGKKVEEPDGVLVVKHVYGIDKADFAYEDF